MGGGTCGEGRPPGTSLQVMVMDLSREGGRGWSNFGPLSAGKW